MATKFSQTQIDTAAGKHQDFINTLEDTHLRALRTEIANTLASSGSKVTTALDQVCEEWITQMKQGVITNMNGMIKAIRSAAADQTEMDLTSARDITNLSMSSSSFLGG
ncbi:hypothetical protein UO65_2913 [Actinokineospora spheciospongiae]|uniref:WXG100 family type VII secretion target n=1 Tax=Actinokineospora spheciospongiae TaxID=909613 RepID=W7J729_9PSEU|nr:hypothetical protein [Actinokineospora spheciospongiae]EWC61854.1 hypothetical protein UO65_2913 [Actinokineospora spheciospongiae]